jgi:diguanylate cyclase (GGDEF)-like protein
MTRPTGETFAADAQAMGLDDAAIVRRKAFYEFGEEDARLLEALHDRLRKVRRSFVDDFYAHLLKFEETRRFIRDPATLERLKQTQSVYFDGLTAGDYGREYIHDRLRVGLAHERAGLEPRWYIGAYNKYLSSLLPEVWRLLGNDPQKFLATYRALQKIVLLDMGLAIDTYIFADKQAISSLKTYAENIIAGLPVGLIVLDAGMRVLDVNRAFLGLVNQAKVSDVELDEILPISELRKQAKELLVSGAGVARVEARLDGKQLQVTLTGIEHAGEQRLLLVVEDITQRKDVETRLAHLATHDALTGLPNRNLLEDRLTQAVVHASRHQRAAGTLFLDLDRFKVVNDSLGHNVGDELLRAVAERLLRCVREGDTVARLGGDEFVVVLNDLARPQDAALVARKILDSFVHPFHVDVPDVGAQEFFFTASIGISLYPNDGSDLPLLLKHADTSMYRAKKRGGNCYQFFTAELDGQAQRRMGLERALHDALEKDQFLVYYQPQIDLTTGQVIGVEALLRWRHPSNGMIAPSEFIGLLEETGMIVPVGEWVLRAVGQQFQAWRKENIPPLRVAVNLSARQLSDELFLDRVVKALAATGMPPEYLMLEITESAVMQNVEQSLAILRKLNEQGIRLSIDDFGTGYSSLSHLKLFPVHEVKIDRSFVRDIPRDENDMAIALAVIALAHAMGLQVVAEGVETGEQLSFLQDHGCDAIQGYLVSHPLPGPELVDLLRKGRLLPIRPN